MDTVEKIQELVRCDAVDARRVFFRMEENGLNMECTQREFVGHVNLACKELDIGAAFVETPGWTIKPVTTESFSETS